MAFTKKGRFDKHCINKRTRSDTVVEEKLSEGDCLINQLSTEVKKEIWGSLGQRKEKGKRALSRSKNFRSGIPFCGDRDLSQKKSESQPAGGGEH